MTHKLSPELHASSNHRLRNEDLSLQGISVTPIPDQFEEVAVLFLVCHASGILTHQDSEFCPVVGGHLTPFVADGGSVTLMDISHGQKWSAGKMTKGDMTSTGIEVGRLVYSLWVRKTNLSTVDIYDVKRTDRATDLEDRGQSNLKTGQIGHVLSCPVRLI
ncbi:hypothetical protein BLNAU_19925 [Blattamonas nauphoetae]|uniref:Uncharacterized protein n=1 Tax=Blattamonas nauphoetae TaxID=2049346 RepID=A0ABQ9X098_9EUKA|nr:hypothetical protein BLNAU_19925 [Blattamonas nauphoetae]